MFVFPVFLFVILYIATRSFLVSIIIPAVFFVFLLVVGNIMSRNYLTCLSTRRHKSYSKPDDTEEERFRISPYATDDADEQETFVYSPDGWVKEVEPKPGEIYKWCEEMREFKVRGTNPATGRIKSMKLVAFNRPGTDVLLEKTGFSDIKSCEVITPEPATPKQLSYARDLGLPVTNDTSKRDVTCMLTRYLQEAGENNEKPPEVLYRKLPEMGECVSPYSSEGGVVSSYYWCCNEREKVEFYLGIMYQRAKGSRDYDIWNLPEWPRIKGCADKLFEDESFMRSLRKNIEGADLWLSYSHIDRSTKAGKMAWDTLLSAGLVTGVPKRKRYNL